MIEKIKILWLKWDNEYILKIIKTLAIQVSTHIFKK